MKPTYDTIGRFYATRRRADPRVAAALRDALGGAERIVNVGAGSGSYEPEGTVIAVEPSREMIAQRPPGLAPVVQAVAEHLPLEDDMADACLAVLTTHHWRDLHAGLAEMLRVAPRAVVLTWDRDTPFWLFADYLPELWAWDRTRFRPIAEHGGEVRLLEIPRDCEDGFLAAYWARPDAYLDPDVRAAMSCFSMRDESEWRAGIDRLGADLASGVWHERYAALLETESLDAGYRVIVLHR